MLGGLADQRVQRASGAGEVFVVGQPSAPVGHAGGLAVALIDVDQVDVAGDVELARAQLAHADDPQRHGTAVRRLRLAVALLQGGAGVLAGALQRQLGQVGHGHGDVLQRRALVAIQHHQPVHDDLAQDAQRRAQVVPARQQRVAGLFHVRARGHAGGQQRQLGAVAALQPLHKARVPGQGPLQRHGFGRRHRKISRQKGWRRAGG